MRPADPDRELARLFSEVRRADEASAPPFAHVLERATAGRAARSRPALFRFAALAAVFAAAALAAALLRRPAPETAGRQRPVTLAQWKSPTDWLLRTPGSELLTALPTLPASVPSYALPHPRKPARVQNR